jgi:hypothetical protein
MIQHKNIVKLHTITATYRHYYPHFLSKNQRFLYLSVTNSRHRTLKAPRGA